MKEEGGQNTISPSCSQCTYVDVREKIVLKARCYSNERRSITFYSFLSSSLLDSFSTHSAGVKNDRHFGHKDVKRKKERGRRALDRLDTQKQDRNHSNSRNKCALNHSRRHPIRTVIDGLYRYQACSFDVSYVVRP